MRFMVRSHNSFEVFALNKYSHIGIGLKSTNLILDSPDPLRILTHLAQNFPKYASSVARRVVVSEELQAEVQKNQYKVQGGVNMAWLNGAIVAEKDMNPFG